MGHEGVARYVNVLYEQTRISRVAFNSYLIITSYAALILLTPLRRSTQALLYLSVELLSSQSALIRCDRIPSTHLLADTDHTKPLSH